MSHILRRIESIYRSQTPLFTLAVVSSIALVSVIDYATGMELDVNFLYLIPLGFWAWLDRTRLCYLGSALSALCGQLANELSGIASGSLGINVFNDLAHFVTFFAFSYLIRTLSTQLRSAQKAAERDFLTGLLNRRALTSRFASEHSRAIRQRSPLTLMCMDLDHFKKLNDEAGHSEGDRLLYVISRVLKTQLRRSDLAARVGGDEFVIVLPDCDHDKSLTVAKRLLGEISEVSRSNGWPVTASLGVLHVPQPSPLWGLSELCDAADKLLYEAKAQGRNRLVSNILKRPEKKVSGRKTSLEEFVKEQTGSAVGV